MGRISMGRISMNQYGMNSISEFEEKIQRERVSLKSAEEGQPSIFFFKICWKECQESLKQ